MPLTASDVVALVRSLDDDQLSALRYRAFELQDDVATTEEERNAAYRETLELELLSAIGAL